MWLDRQSACLPLMKHYWPQSPPLHKPGVVAHTCPRIQEVDSTQHIPSQPGLSNEILSQKKKQEEEEKEEDEEEEEEEEEREEEEQRQQEWRLYLAYQALCGLGCVAASQNKQAGFFFSSFSVQNLKKTNNLLILSLLSPSQFFSSSPSLSLPFPLG